jgi:eukaryotic-like serine/threonine-protein kinase
VRGPFIVMEFLHGETLAALITRMRLRPAEAIDLLMPALRGVHAAHQHGVVHRDLKPENIFLCRTRAGAPAEAKVLDFGISKLTFDTDPVDTLTRPGALIGTPHYMSPERVRGQRETDRRSDVYAFGVILYEVLTGKLPFDSTHVGELIVQISTQAPRPLRAIDATIPPALEAVVLKAMARRVADRYPDLESLGRALEPFAGGQRFDVALPEPTGRHRTDWPPAREDANTNALTPVGAGAGAATSEPVTTITPPGVAKSRRVMLGAAIAVAIATGAALTALLWSGDEQAGPANGVTAAIAPNAPRPVAQSPAVVREAVAPRPGAVTSGGVGPVDLPPSADDDSARAAQTVTPRAAGKAPAAAGAPKQAARPRAGVRPTAKRVRVARGVRTRGMSEQDF